MNKKGFIISGYPCIGKSSISGDGTGFIDLESSCFKLPDCENDPNWYKRYCKQAVYLAKQGYNVFVSSHKEVYKTLESEPNFLVICPDPSIRLQWIKRAEERYNSSLEVKNWSALDRIQKFYLDDIYEIITYCTNHRIPVLRIATTDYDLAPLVNAFISKVNEYYCEFFINQEVKIEYTGNIYTDRLEASKESTTSETKTDTDGDLSNVPTISDIMKDYRNRRPQPSITDEDQDQMRIIYDNKDTSTRAEQLAEILRKQNESKAPSYVGLMNSDIHDSIDDKEDHDKSKE